MSHRLAQFGYNEEPKSLEALIMASKFSLKGLSVADVSIDNFSLVSSQPLPKIKVTTGTLITGNDAFELNFDLDYRQVLPNNQCFNIYDKKAIEAILKEVAFDAIFGSEDTDDWDSDETISVEVSSKNKDMIEWIQDTAANCRSWEYDGSHYAELTAASAGVVLCYFANMVNIENRTSLGNQLLLEMRNKAVAKLNE